MAKVELQFDVHVASLPSTSHTISMGYTVWWEFFTGSNFCRLTCIPETHLNKPYIDYGRGGAVYINMHGETRRAAGAGECLSCYVCSNVYKRQASRSTWPSVCIVVYQSDWVARARPCTRSRTWGRMAGKIRVCCLT